MTTEAKAPDPIRQACRQWLIDHGGYNPDSYDLDNFLRFVMQQRAAARAEAFEEAALISDDMLDDGSDAMDAALKANRDGSMDYSSEQVIEDIWEAMMKARAAERAAQEANHD